MEHEKSIIPAIITRCIQEVELRGLSLIPGFLIAQTNSRFRHGHGRHLPQVRC